MNNKLEKIISECQTRPDYWKEYIKLNKQSIKFNKNLINYYDQLLHDPYSKLNKSVKKYMQLEIIKMTDEINRDKQSIKKAQSSLKSL